jgi:hypothetical protein
MLPACCPRPRAIHPDNLARASQQRRLLSSKVAHAFCSAQDGGNLE